ncbi:hypothetical protein BBJ28_00020816 [Nothophytophthora sp. Chile5]|nr:hypothetical protein BBJ28_00020816 [Nothophytophthora sp. Chile5]
MLAFQTRLDTAPSDSPVVMEVFTDIEKAGGLGLSRTVSSRLAIDLARQNYLDECLRVFALSWEQGLRPSTAAYAIALKAFARAERNEDALRMFGAMRYNGSVREKWTYATTLVAATKLQQQELVLQICNEMKHRKMDASEACWLMFEAACKSKQHDLVLKTLEYIHENDMDTSVAYASAFRAAAKVEQHEFVVEIFRHMKRHGVVTTRDNWFVVLRNFSDVGADAMMEVFADIEKDGEVQLSGSAASMLIASLAKQKRFDECLRVLNYSWELGTPLNTTAYSMALDGFSKAEQFENTLRVFDAMRNGAGVDEKGKWMYKTALLAATKLKRNELVFEIFNYMNENYVDTVGVYVHVLGTACKSQQHNFVLEVLDYMHENGLDMANAYASTIGAAAKSEQYAFVLEVFQHMLENSVEPTSKNYDSVLYGCARLGDVALAQEISETMRQRGLNITASGFKSLLHCAAKTGRWEVAVNAVANLETPRSSSRSRDVISKLVTRLAKERRLDECWRVLESCWERDLSPTGDAYAAAFNNLSKANQFERVLRVFDVMRTEGAITKTWTYTTAVLAAMNLKRNELVFAIFNYMKDNNVDATDAYSSVLGAACKSKQHDLVFETLDHMSEDGLDTANAYKSIIGKAIDSAQHDFVFELLHRMIENRVDPAAEYSHVLRTACKSKQHDFVVEIFQHMQQNGVEPTSDDCKIALQSCNLAGDDELKKRIKNLLLQRIHTAKDAVRLRG